MSAQYKLTYFDGRGLAETSRYLFKYGGIDFEDVRIQREDWPELKNKTPFGQLPFLEHKGRTVGQSHSIARYLAKIVGLAGKNDWENLEIDSIVDTINDARLKLSAIFYEQDEGRKKALIDTFTKETLPFYLPRLEKQVQENNGYLVLGRLTWADFYFATISPIFDRIADQDCLQNYPNLLALREKVEALPAIKQWIQVRPKTEF